MIYFLRSHVTGHIKIGYTGDIEKRFISLRSKYGEFDVLGIMKGTLNDERNLHKQFAHLNVNNVQYGWEWFLEDHDLTDFIAQFTIEYSEITQDIEPLPTPLELTIGPSKAQILTILHQPLNTGELAVKLSLTAGSVSQQLKNLQMAGLVESYRVGKNVCYRLTKRGKKLIDLFQTE